MIMKESKTSEQRYKYFAFISYSSKDTEWGKRLQQKLEGYRMPATLCNEHGWERTPIKPVFFAPTDIQPGGLTEELQERLRASRNLIVICSPNSAKSEWVGKEIEFFHQFGRTKQIHFFIVDGQPHSGNPDTECFNPVVDKLVLSEILGANIHEKIYRWPWVNKERAYVQLISKLLGVEFDTIWQRHKRLLIQKMIAWSVGVVVVLTALLGVWFTNQPVDVQLSLKEASHHNEQLPPLKDAVITMMLDGEMKRDTIRSLDGSITFTHIPHSFKGKEVRVTVDCPPDFLTTDTTIVLTEIISIDVRRNPEIYGNVHFSLWNPDTEQTLPHAKILVDGNEVISDDSGYVSLSIPLTQQKKIYSVISTMATLTDSIIVMPCGPDDIIEYK